MRRRVFKTISFGRSSFTLHKQSSMNSFTMDDIVVVETKIKKGILSSEPSSESVNGERSDNDIFFAGSQDFNCQVDLGSDVTKCCVPNCATSSISNINSSQISFVTFPKDPSRFTEWIRAIGRPDLLSYLGKKEATNLLVCSKHFPRNMWINPNTRIKRLHKSAVPEKSYDDDIDIIAVTSVSEKTNSPARKTGIKVKKVTSLLTDSALRTAFSSQTVNMQNISPVVDSPMEFKGRKLPLILPRPKSFLSGNTPAILKSSKSVSRTQKGHIPPRGSLAKNLELEKLKIENMQIKEELDKNMDFILSQKAHYEGLISKEKGTIIELENRITTLEGSQRKMCLSYENQLQSKKASESRETINKIKSLQQLNESYEKKLEVEMQTINNLQAMNNELQSQIEELVQEKGTTTTTHLPTPARPHFTGENFKDFLYLHLDKEKQLEEKVTDLLVEVNKTTTEGKKEHILNEASCYLNHLHLSWLRWVLNMEGKETDFEERLREFALSIYEASKEAYVKCAKAFGLPSCEEIKKYIKDPSSAKGNSNSLINALYDKAETLPSKELVNKTVSDSDKGYDDVLDYEGKSKRKNHWKESSYFKKFKNDDDDEEEGKVSDEDEEVVFTDSEEEEEEEEEDDDDDEEDEDEDESDKEKANIIKEEEIIDAKDILLASKIEIPVASTSSQDFDDFMVEEEALEIPKGEASLRTNIQPQQQENHVHTMPLLDLDSSMAVSRRDIINSNSAADLKISNRKKVISSDTSLPSGSKVVFRVIES